MTTAYRYNAIPRSARAVRSGWAPGIDRLLAAGHEFLPYGYAGKGLLFRGLGSGLRAGLLAGAFGRCDSGHALCALEHELGVHLLSHELSDALAVARLWEGRADSGLLAFPASVFEAAMRARRAAVLGFAEPGVVFRYPFLIDALRLADVALLFVPSAAAADALAALAGVPAPVPVVIGAAPGGRGLVEASLRARLTERGLAPATPVPAACVPSRQRSTGSLAVSGCSNSRE
jgi:hypothetical protein